MKQYKHKTLPYTAVWNKASSVYEVENESKFGYVTYIPTDLIENGKDWEEIQEPEPEPEPEKKWSDGDMLDFAMFAYTCDEDISLKQALKQWKKK